MARLVAPVVVLFLLFGRGPRVNAQSVEPVERTTSIYALSGLGAPFGFFGIETVHRFGPTVELAAGIGSGLAATLAQDGFPLQWSLMPRVRIGRPTGHNFTLGAGISGGNFANVNVVDCDNDCSPPVHYMMWANFEIGVERWSQSGFAVRSFIGYAHGLLADVPSASLDFPYFGGGMGYAF